MAFRPADRPARPSKSELTSRMVGIGMQFAGKPAEEPRIEETLVFASEAGMVDDDLRVLSVLVTWLDLHHPYINADRLIRIVKEQTSDRVCAFWAAIGMRLGKDRRFRRLEGIYQRPPIGLLAVGNDFQIERHGIDDRFADSPLIVTRKALRARVSDVQTVEALSRHHNGYRNRVIMGPTWRADVWTALQAQPELSATQAARVVGCAFATAWSTKRDFDLVARASGISSVA